MVDLWVGGVGHSADLPGWTLRLPTEYQLYAINNHVFYSYQITHLLPQETPTNYLISINFWTYHLTSSQ